MQILVVKLAFFREFSQEQHTNDVTGLWLDDFVLESMWDVDLEIFCAWSHCASLVGQNKYTSQTFNSHFSLCLLPSLPPCLQISIVSTDDDLSWSSWFFCFFYGNPQSNGASSFLRQRLSVATAAALTVRPHAFWSALCHYLWRGWPQQMLFIMWILQWIMCHNCFHSVKYSGLFFFPFGCHCFGAADGFLSLLRPSFHNRREKRSESQFLGTWKLPRGQCFLIQQRDSVGRDANLDLSVSVRDATRVKDSVRLHFNSVRVERGQGSLRSEAFIWKIGPNYFLLAWIKQAGMCEYLCAIMVWAIISKV